MIPYARPKIFKKDISKVNTVLNSQFLTLDLKYLNLKIN